MPNAKSRSGVDSFVIYLSAGNGRPTGPSLDTDESYTLELLPKGKLLEARITGKSYFGVRHGLETLSQMIDLVGRDLGEGRRPQGAVPRLHRG